LTVGIHHKPEMATKLANKEITEEERKKIQETNFSIDKGKV
jgi:hypothetical protein